MDSNQREERLQQLARLLLLGKMTDEQRREYDALQEEQSEELHGSLFTLSRKEVDSWLKRAIKTASCIAFDDEL